MNRTIFAETQNPAFRQHGPEFLNTIATACDQKAVSPVRLGMQTG